ncbi:MAG TPA: DNA-3-methyladenine glycosylase [Nitrososphaeraceae archaeon]|nr:DNA-3-methyladenine glycosylase [Nitrososphaeraceae archaeon]
MNVKKKSIFTQNFFLRDTTTVAQDLLGKKLVRILTKNNEKIKLSGIIVETEAYGFKNDQASHAFKGKTKGNEIMFGPVGRSYIYFIYGNHYCFNITARSQDEIAGAVLIRALEPYDGIKYLMSNRNQQDVNLLSNGPGKITQALCIGKQHNNYNVIDINNELYIEEGTRPELILATKRIGITKSIDKYWRYVSAKKNSDIIIMNKYVTKRKENYSFKVLNYYKENV